MADSRVPDPRAEQEAHPIFQAFLADREKPEHCWYCSKPLVDEPWSAWWVSFYKKKITSEGKQQCQAYLQTHDFDAQALTVVVAPGPARGHALCYHINEKCTLWPTAEELMEQWEEEEETQ